MAKGIRVKRREGWKMEQEADGFGGEKRKKEGRYKIFGNYFEVSREFVLLVGAGVGLGVVAEVKLVAVGLLLLVHFLEALVRGIQTHLFVILFFLSEVGH